MPAYCYADRMDTMEEVSEDDFRKMGLFKGLMVVLGTQDHVYEFPGDVQYNPFTGEEEEARSRGYTLDDFQAKVMEMVHEN
jgi:hypothetical protein